jgi:hypothetical protein
MLLERLQGDDWQKGDELTAKEVLDFSMKVPVETLREGLKSLIG